MHADLTTLLKLQEHDQVVMGIEAELKSLEPEIEQLDQELARAQADLDAARKGAGDAEQRRAELEGKIESYRVMQERRRQRLEWVRGAKEASTLMAELDLARTVLAKEEAEWIRSADRVQEAARKVEQVDKVVEELRAAQAPRREAVDALRAEKQERLEAARGERNRVSADVRPALLVQYDRIRKGRAPLAIYQLHGDACGHCFTAVPRHRRQAILDGQSVGTCEACGVMIYHVNS